MARLRLREAARRVAAFLKGWSVAIACIGASGCAIGNHGAVLGRLTRADGAWVVDVYAVGLHVRPTDAEEAGVTLGATHRAYVFAAQDVGEPARSWSLLSVPVLPWERALVRQLETAGIDIRLSSPTPGLTLGAQSITASRPASSGRSEFRSVMYDPGRPERSCVSLDWERQCCRNSGC